MIYIKKDDIQSGEWLCAILLLLIANHTVVLRFQRVTVGHMQKRLGTALQKLKKTWGKKKLEDGKTIGGRGRLTANLMDKLTEKQSEKIMGVLMQWKRLLMLFFTESQCINTVQKEQTGGVGGK